MAAQPPPYAYPVDPSTGYPAPQQQPGYPAGYDPAAAQAGYPAQGYAPTDVKPGGVDAYGQPAPGGYPQQPPGYQPYPTQTAPPTGYSAQQQAATTVSSQSRYFSVYQFKAVCT